MYGNGEGKILGLVGAPATGKSELGVRLAHVVTEMGLPSVFIPEPEFSNPYLARYYEELTAWLEFKEKHPDQDPGPIKVALASQKYFLETATEHLINVTGKARRDAVIVADMTPEGHANYAVDFSRRGIFSEPMWEEYFHLLEKSLMAVPLVDMLLHIHVADPNVIPARVKKRDRDYERGVDPEEWKRKLATWNGYPKSEISAAMQIARRKRSARYVMPEIRKILTDRVDTLDFEIVEGLARNVLNELAELHSPTK